MSKRKHGSGPKSNSQRDWDDWSHTMERDREEWNEQIQNIIPPEPIARPMGVIERSLSDRSICTRGFPGCTIRPMPGETYCEWCAQGRDHD